MEFEYPIIVRLENGKLKLFKSPEEVPDGIVFEVVNHNE